MINTIVFDLDGTLVQSGDLHKRALNSALMEVSQSYVITNEEHLSSYNGLPTKEKLNKLTRDKNLPLSKHKEISKRKQEITHVLLDKEIKFDMVVYDTLFRLKDEGYLLGLATNSIRETTEILIERLRLGVFLDVIVTNEDGECKPSPSLYNKAVEKLGVSPENTIAVEDGEYGRLAAQSANLHVMFVDSPKDVYYNNVIEFIRLIDERCYV